MEILMLFFVLFGVGALLGLAYVGLKAIFMTARGSVWAGRGLVAAARDGIRKGVEQGKADIAAMEAAKAARLRERP